MRNSSFEVNFLNRNNILDCMKKQAIISYRTEEIIAFLVVNILKYKRNNKYFKLY